MIVIKVWEVLDCRTLPAKSYKMKVGRSEDGKLWVYKEDGKKIKLFFQKEGGTLELHLVSAQTFIRHLEAHACLVWPRGIKLAKAG